MRASVADLPQETAQQADSMRRIVADQIKALEELSEIVTRSGRSFDVSVPPSTAAERQTPAASSRRQEQPRLPEPERAPEAEPRRPRAPTPAPGSGPDALPPVQRRNAAVGSLTFSRAPRPRRPPRLRVNGKKRCGEGNRRKDAASAAAAR